eukprot:6225502-Prorocentrum_lima.AAC.1
MATWSMREMRKRRLLVRRLQVWRAASRSWLTRSSRRTTARWSMVSRSSSISQKSSSCRRVEA